MEMKKEGVSKVSSNKTPLLRVLLLLEGGEFSYF